MILHRVDAVQAPAFLTPEEQLRRDRIVNTPSWGAFVFPWIYLAAMHAWRHEAVVLAIFASALGYRFTPSPIPVLRAVSTGAVLALWLYVGVAGKRIAWLTRTWQDLNDFVRCQRAWDRWGKGVAVVGVPVMAVGIAREVLRFNDRWAQLTFLGTLCVTLALALWGIWRMLRAGAGSPRAWGRALLATGWVAAYILWVAAIEVFLDKLGIERTYTGLALAVGWLVGPALLVSRMSAWSATSRKPVAAGVSAPQGVSAATVLRIVAESLGLPFRRPVLFLPFLAVVGIPRLLAPSKSTPSLPHDQLGWLALGLAAIVTVPLITLAGEMTSEMVAQCEFTTSARLGPAVRAALRRLPASLAAMILMGLGLFIGFVVLIIPGVILFVRWVFVPHAVLFAKSGPMGAFKISREMTRGRGWSIALLLLLIFLGSAGLKTTLSRLPQSGDLLAAWLDFSWATIALTLMYVRAGGPVAR